MSKKNKENDIIISFLGTSNTDVTGSSVLINYPKGKKERGNLLLELGLCQGSPTPEKDISSNRKMLENFSKELIGTIEHAICGHAHIDHVGNLAFLNDENEFSGTIIGSKATIEVAKELIKDSVYIHTKNIRTIKEKTGKKIKPIYTEPQMYNMFERMVGVDIGIKHKLNEQITYRLINSGHVLGGCMIELWITKPNNSVKHVIYSSDMGSSSNNQFQYFVPLKEQVDKCNLFISEATYNNPDRSFSKKEAISERETLKRDIKDALLNNKRILFSAFSFSRCQNLMCMLYDWFSEEEWFKSIPVVLDGVLLHTINSVYSRVLEGEDKKYFDEVLAWRNFKKNKSYDSTIATLSQRTTGIYIATSGFLQNGRITTYLQHFLGSKKDVVYITGFCGNTGSIGWKILNPEQKTVTIDKSVIMKSAEIKQLKTFSSHIQFDELLKLYRGINCEKILIHHSSEDGKEEFGNIVREDLKSIGKTTKVVVINKNDNQIVL